MSSPLKPPLQGRDIPFEELQNALLEGLQDREIPGHIESIQKHFHSRENLNRYSQSLTLVSAYSLIYGSTNMPKWWQLLSWIEAQKMEEFFQAPFIDMGCGPGVFSLAHKMYADKFSLAGPSQFFLCDQSALMLKQAEKFWQRIAGSAPAEFMSPYGFKEREVQDALLCFGHSLNEMGRDKALDWVKKLEPRWVVVVEPGTSECFSEILKFRQELFEWGYRVLFPCANSLPCPLLDEGREKEWCHQVLRTTFPGELERLCQLSTLDRKVQPMVAHIYERRNASPSRSLASFYRFLRETKHSFEWQVCLQEGGRLKLKTFEISKKTLSKKRKKDLTKMSTGGQFAYRLIKVLDGERWRVEIE